MADDSEPEGSSPDHGESDAPTSDTDDASGSSSDSTLDAQSTDAEGTLFEFVDPELIDVETAAAGDDTSGDDGASGDDEADAEQNGGDTRTDADSGDRDGVTHDDRVSDDGTDEVKTADQAVSRDNDVDGDDGSDGEDDDGSDGEDDGSDEDVDYVNLEPQGVSVSRDEDDDADDTTETSPDADDASETGPDSTPESDGESDATTESDADDDTTDDGAESKRSNARHRSRQTRTPDDPPAPDDAEAVADTDGGEPAAVADAGTGSGTGEAEVVDDGFLNDAPESDQEMPLTDHIEEMVRRLAVVFAVGGIITLVLYPGADIVNSALNMNLLSATDVINFLWNKHIPGAPEIVDRRPRVYGPLELVLTELKVAGLAGLVVGLPVFVYETYLFMRPGLFPTERRYYLAAVPTSLVLAIIGVAFAHFIVLPAIFSYFTSYTTGTAIVAFGLKETFNLILILMGYNAIIFQIPLFIMLAIMMNLVTRVWLVERRLLFWASFLGLAFFVSPDPTGMAPIIIAATMITLFEGTLFLLRWTGN